MDREKISEATIKRLPLYLRYLIRLQNSGVKKISSNEIGENLEYNPAKVRKDLSYFGEFGKKGYGYDIEVLIRRIERILQLDREIPVCLIGFGKLGQALVDYNIYLEKHMKIKAIFDSDKEKFGTQVNNLTIHPESDIAKVIKEMKIEVGIITVPPEYAQKVADLLVDSGVKAILNFAPIIIKTPNDVRVHYADFTTELHSLAYFLNKK